MPALASAFDKGQPNGAESATRRVRPEPTMGKILIPDDFRVMDYSPGQFKTGIYRKNSSFNKVSWGRGEWNFSGSKEQ